MKEHALLRSKLNAVDRTRDVATTILYHASQGGDIDELPPLTSDFKRDRAMLWDEILISPLDCYPAKPICLAHALVKIELAYRVVMGNCDSFVTTLGIDKLKELILSSRVPLDDHFNQLLVHIVFIGQDKGDETSIVTRNGTQYSEFILTDLLKLFIGMCSVYRMMVIPESNVVMRFDHTTVGCDVLMRKLLYVLKMCKKVMIRLVIEVATILRVTHVFSVYVPYRHAITTHCDKYMAAYITKTVLGHTKTAENEAKKMKGDDVARLKVWCDDAIWSAVQLVFFVSMLDISINTCISLRYGIDVHMRCADKDYIILDNKEHYIYYDAQRAEMWHSKDVYSLIRYILDKMTIHNTRHSNAIAVIKTMLDGDKIDGIVPDTLVAIVNAYQSRSH